MLRCEQPDRHHADADTCSSEPFGKVYRSSTILLIIYGDRRVVSPVVTAIDTLGVQGTRRTAAHVCVLVDSMQASMKAIPSAPVTAFGVTAASGSGGCPLRRAATRSAKSA